MYVNVPMLISSLSKYNPFQEKVYIGKWPLNAKNNPVSKFFTDAFPDHVKE